MTRAFRIVMAALTVLVVLTIASGPALAQPTYPPTSVAPTVVEPETKPEVVAETETAPLAFTGAELTLLVAAFGILLAGGAVAMIAARRRSRPQTS